MIFFCFLYTYFKTYLHYATHYNISIHLMQDTKLSFEDVDLDDFKETTQTNNQGE
jgi:kynurenine formamidase